MKALSALLLLSCALHAAEPIHAENPDEAMAKGYGWLANFKLGKEMIQDLATKGAYKLGKVQVSAYRGERVAFVGYASPPGATNDLLTKEGFYLRIVTPAGKDLRPHSISWDVLVCGKILQVLAKNRIIVIEVNKQDWKVTQTF